MRVEQDFERERKASGTDSRRFPFMLRNQLNRSKLPQYVDRGER